MKLPKQLDKEGVEADVRAQLEKDQFEICSESNISIPSFELNPELRKHIFYAKSMGELAIGYENIEKVLDIERKGLQNVDNQSERVSRLLIVTNDGSPRFYRELKYLQHKQGGRVLICRLNVDSLLMGQILGMKERAIKAILINRKRAVVNVLKEVGATEKIQDGQARND
jgi:hypothetical protein